MQQFQDQQYFYSQKHVKLFHGLDRYFSSLVSNLGADEQIYPSLLPKKFLEKIDYFNSFPHVGLRAQPLLSNIDSTNFLPSAVCYHLFHHLEGKDISQRNSIFTSVGRCYRQEEEYHYARLAAFTMREIIVIGEPAYVTKTLEILSNRILDFARQTFKNVYFEKAADPFYLPSAKGQKLYQQLKNLKQELLVKFEHDKPVAISSCNQHERFFSRKLDIRSKGKYFHSGCLAFGIDRWVWAICKQHSQMPQKWPSKIKQLL